MGSIAANAIAIRKLILGTELTAPRPYLVKYSMFLTMTFSTC